MGAKFPLFKTNDFPKVITRFRMWINLAQRGWIFVDKLAMKVTEKKFKCYIISMYQTSIQLHEETSFDWNNDFLRQLASVYSKSRRWWYRTRFSIRMNLRHGTRRRTFHFVTLTSAYTVDMTEMFSHLVNFKYCVWVASCSFYLSTLT